MKERIHPLKVVHATPLAPQIIQLLLQPEMPIRYQAGDYIMLGFSADDVKPFSIATAPRDDGLLECHIRNQADSDWMKQLFAVQTGDHLVMQGPKPQMQLKNNDLPMIFVAGGTGFAPMKALLDEALRQNRQVPIAFYWGARHTEELYLHQSMLELAQQHANLTYIPVISETCPEWTGRKGLVHQQVLADFNDLSGQEIYLCGPWPMVQAAKQDFMDAGMAENHFTH